MFWMLPMHVVARLGVPDEDVLNENADISHAHMRNCEWLAWEPDLGVLDLDEHGNGKRNTKRVLGRACCCWLLLVVACSCLRMLALASWSILLFALVCTCLLPLLRYRYRCCSHVSVAPLSCLFTSSLFSVAPL